MSEDIKLEALWFDWIKAEKKYSMSEDIKLEALWFDWIKAEKKFTAKEVQELIDEIKKFNAGAIDKYLTKHVDTVFNEWINGKK